MVRESLGRLRVGTSGWQYRHWAGVFYPPDVPQAKWLDWYVRHFDTVEINNSFYRLPSADCFGRWRQAAPPSFVYAVKFSRFGTHMKHLRDPESTIGLFVDHAKALGPKLGPVLVQLPPRWHVDAPRLDAFLQAAPKRYRWAVEVRDGSWLCDAVYTTLERHGAALVIHDLLPDHPRVLTAGWTYWRYHGAPKNGRYGSSRLRAEAVRVRRALADGIDVYAYFNNDLGGHAVADARELRRQVLGRSVDYESRAAP